MFLKLSNVDFDRCEKFALEQLNTSFDMYKLRGESNFTKMKEDIIIGKLGELAVAKWLRKTGRKCNRVDFSIYERKNKSFGPDLVCEKFNVHIKSQGQQSIKRYGKSWLLQKNDKITRSPTDEDYLCFTSVDLANLEVDILGFVKVKDIISEGCLDEPRVPRYRATKIALYFENIEEKCRVYHEL